MRLYTDEEKKEVEVWVSHSDSESELEKALAKYLGRYYVVIFRSGSEDLTSCTKALIRHNYSCACL